MTILIPIAILAVLMTLAGYYFATHEGKLQQANGAPLDTPPTRVKTPLSTPQDPTAAHTTQQS